MKYDLNYKLKYSQISCIKELKLISNNTECKSKNVTIVRHLVKYERSPEIRWRKKPREKNECSGSDIEVIPCTSSLILPRWRTEGFDFSDIRKSRRSRNSIVLSRDSVQGLTSKSTYKTGNIERRKKSRLMSRAIYCDKRRIKLIIFVVFRIHFFLFWKEIRARPHGNNTNERWKKKKEKKRLCSNLQFMRGSDNICRRRNSNICRIR